MPGLVCLDSSPSQMPLPSPPPHWRVHQDSASCLGGSDLGYGDGTVCLPVHLLMEASVLLIQGCHRETCCERSSTSLSFSFLLAKNVKSQLLVYMVNACLAHRTSPRGLLSVAVGLLGHLHVSILASCLVCP